MQFLIIFLPFFYLTTLLTAAFPLNEGPAVMVHELIRSSKLLVRSQLAEREITLVARKGENNTKKRASYNQQCSGCLEWYQDKRSVIQCQQVHANRGSKTELDVLKARLRRERLGGRAPTGTAQTRHNLEEARRRAEQDEQARWQADHDRRLAESEREMAGLERNRQATNERERQRDASLDRLIQAGDRTRGNNRPRAAR
ncbi:hypothetical protein C8J56DRAFT_949599 [Mycena floridula]|nr:hypothetical protein C8J56DRAFT_949599 [Mycena floridula]